MLLQGSSPGFDIGQGWLARPAAGPCHAKVGGTSLRTKRRSSAGSSTCQGCWHAPACCTLVGDTSRRTTGGAHTMGLGTSGWAATGCTARDASLGLGPLGQFGNRGEGACCIGCSTAAPGCPGSSFELRDRRSPSGARSLSESALLAGPLSESWLMSLHVLATVLMRRSRCGARPTVTSRSASWLVRSMATSRHSSLTLAWRPS
mmetsp:Transcript_20911/g.43419  ORF Transcript_20911/g.43419 Transcript_20911/m.43419 type:complete len:204 (-) Transcript_20911:289-900(-)